MHEGQVCLGSMHVHSAAISLNKLVVGLLSIVCNVSWLLLMRVL